jgi:mannose-6-phosphate isomerase-like protein (cupin superfamily)
MRIALAAALAALTLVPLAARAQATAAAAPPLITYASSADVQALIANARRIHKDEPTVTQPILSLAPYRASLEYRTAVGPSAVHEKEAEFFYVIEGSGTLVTGGKLKDEKRQNAANLGGTGIDGGQPRAVAKGDFIVVPEGQPHWFSDIKGELILMSLHVPRG